LLTLLDPRNGPSWDLSAPATRRAYVIASTPRTGSTLFANALWDTGRAGAPKEYLNPMQLRDFAVRFRTPGSIRALVGSDAGAMREHLQRVRAVRTGANGWFGLKLHHHHFERWWHVVEDLVAPVAWFHVVRRDRLAQAISWERALQTGRWADFQRGRLPPLFSRARIQRRLDAIERAEAGWAAFFVARRIVPCELVYEDAVADLDGAVRGALRFLGEPDDLAPIAPSQTRQADALSAAWRERFLGGDYGTSSMPLSKIIPTPRA
jgi:trehalose 2-sulfotransferase